jgi:hypothetical protein
MSKKRKGLQKGRQKEYIEIAKKLQKQKRRLALEVFTFSSLIGLLRAHQG